MRLTGPVKHFLCQPNATGHPTGGANVSSQMFGDGDGGSAAAPQPTPAPAPEPAPAPAPAPDRGPATQRGPAPAAADGAVQADESDERVESPTSASVRQYVEAANAAPTTPQRPAALDALSALQPTTAQEAAIDNLYKMAKAAGGSLPAHALGELYVKQPSAKDAIKQAGELQGLCVLSFGRLTFVAGTESGISDRVWIDEKQQPQSGPLLSPAGPRSLDEQREAGVHPSQAKVKVVI